MNNIDYEKAFKKVAEQVRLELSWAKEDNEEMPKRTFKEGMVFAYSSIEELVGMIEKGDFEECKVSEDDEEDWG